VSGVPCYISKIRYNLAMLLPLTDQGRSVP